MVYPPAGLPVARLGDRLASRRADDPVESVTDPVGGEMDAGDVVRGTRHSLIADRVRKPAYAAVPELAPPTAQALSEAFHADPLVELGDDIELG